MRVSVIRFEEATAFCFDCALVSLDVCVSVIEIEEPVRISGGGAD